MAQNTLAYFSGPNFSKITGCNCPKGVIQEDGELWVVFERDGLGLPTTPAGGYLEKHWESEPRTSHLVSMHPGNI